MTSTRALLAGGVISGPLFTAVTAAQMLTRAGFDPKRHPISLLGLGDLGRPQVAGGALTWIWLAAVALRELARGDGDHEPDAGLGRLVEGAAGDSLRRAAAPA